MQKSQNVNWSSSQRIYVDLNSVKLRSKGIMSQSTASGFEETKSSVDDIEM